MSAPNDGPEQPHASWKHRDLDGLIWQVNEYASLVHEVAQNVLRQPSLRPAVSRLGLSARQLSFLQTVWSR